MVVGTRVAIFSSLFGLFSSLLGANTQSIRQGWQGCVCEREREQGTPGDVFVSNEEMVVVVVVVLLQGKGDRAAAIIRSTHPATTRALFCSSLNSPSNTVLGGNVCSTCIDDLLLQPVVFWR